MNDFVTVVNRLAGYGQLAVAASFRRPVDDHRTGQPGLDHRGVDLLRRVRGAGGNHDGAGALLPAAGDAAVDKGSRQAAMAGLRVGEQVLHLPDAIETTPRGAVGARLAGLHAAQRADKLMAEGDMEGRRVWHRIGDAIDELQRTAPGTGDSVH